MSRRLSIIGNADHFRACELAEADYFLVRHEGQDWVVLAPTFLNWLKDGVEDIDTLTKAERIARSRNNVHLFRGATKEAAAAHDRTLHVLDHILGNLDEFKREPAAPRCTNFGERHDGQGQTEIDNPF